MGYPGWPSTRCLHSSGRPSGGAFQRNPLSQHCRGTNGGNALAFYATLPLLLTSRPSFSFSSWTLLTGGPKGKTMTPAFSMSSLAAGVYILVKMNPAPAPDPHQLARPLADLLTAIARLLARRQPHNAPSLHTAWTIQQIVNEEYRILEGLNYELATHTPAALIEVFKQRLSLWWQQQLQQSQRPLLSPAPPQLAHSRCARYC